MVPDPPGPRGRARRETARCGHALARDAAAPLVTRPMHRAADAPSVRDVEPLAAARAARALELAARGYIRQAREAGHDWDQIGHALGLSPDADAGPAGATIPDAAWTYAAGPPDARAPWRPFSWTCHACDQHITDQGPVARPADDEHGHAGNCPRLAKAIAEWNARWQAEP